MDGPRADHGRTRRDPAPAGLRRAGSRRPPTAAHLPAALDALGVTHVVVRNDLDTDEVDAPDHALVRAAVANVPGASLAAAFGATSDGDAAVEVYELRHDAEPRVDVQDWEDRLVVDGAPEVVPSLRAAGLLDGAGPPCSPRATSVPTW